MKEEAEEKQLIWINKHLVSMVVGNRWIPMGKLRSERENKKEVFSEERFFDSELKKMFLDRDGNLWFGTVNGATKYIPGVKKFNRTPPKLQMKAVELFFEPFQADIEVGRGVHWH